MPCSVFLQGPLLCVCVCVCVLGWGALSHPLILSCTIWLALAIRTGRHHPVPVLSFGFKRPFAILPPLWEGHVQVSPLALTGLQRSCLWHSVPGKSRPELGHRWIPDIQNYQRARPEQLCPQKSSNKGLLFSAVCPAVKLTDTTSNHFCFSLSSTSWSHYCFYGPL